MGHAAALRPPLSTGRALWLAAAALALFALDAALVFSGATAPADQAIMLAAPELHGAVGNALAVFVSQGLGGKGLVPATVVLVAFLLWRKRKADAVLVAAPMVAGLLMMIVLKLVFERARPTLFPWIDHASGYSFPSGHSFLNAVFWLLVAIVAARPWVWALAIGMALFAGIFRVVCGVHWPSDVLAGWSLGVALVAAAVALRRRFTRPPASANTEP